MAENKTNWNTVLIVLVIGVVGILLINNSNLLSGLVTKKSTTTETVICMFDSEDMQKCYSVDENNWGCSGIGSCKVKVSGEKGQTVRWESSCESVGLIVTKIDGIDEKIKFGGCTTNTEPASCVINGLCEPQFGENEKNCPEDCASVKANSCDADGTCEIKSLYVSGKVGFSALKGKRNAYACLDSSGNLFRSEKPCPSLI